MSDPLTPTDEPRPTCICAELQAADRYPDCPIHVDCDDWCGALRDPQTLDEYKATLEHWQGHSYLSGCSHAC